MKRSRHIQRKASPSAPTRSRVGASMTSISAIMVRGAATMGSPAIPSALAPAARKLTATMAPMAARMLRAGYAAAREAARKVATARSAPSPRARSRSSASS